MRDYITEIRAHFSYGSDKFFDVVNEVLTGIEPNDMGDDDCIMQAISDNLIYTEDKWTVLEQYCEPESANWDEAYEDFTTDVMILCSKIVEEYGYDEDDEDEYDDEDDEDEDNEDYE